MISKHQKPGNALETLKKQRIAVEKWPFREFKNRSLRYPRHCQQKNSELSGMVMNPAASISYG